MQASRTQNPDRKARFEFVMPALSADPAVRERAFARLVLRRESTAGAVGARVAQYLNHPLREAHARRFVLPALGMVREIQRTGDIFFPTRWMEATLGGHNSSEVAGIVRGLSGQRELQYPQRLRWTILTAADELFRITRR